MEFPRLIIAGTSSGVGKTTVVMGLLKAISKYYIVQPFKVGPDYIDPTYHSHISGRKSRNLDGWILDDETIIHLFRKNIKEADIALIEGVMGLYDGVSNSSQQGSTAQIAKILKAPVILIIDGSGISTSIAAIVKGYQEFDREVEIKGVIINGVSGEGHYLLLKDAIEKHTKIKVFGYLTHQKEYSLPERHLGLVPSLEMTKLDESLNILAQNIEQTVDINGLLELALSWTKEVPKSTFNIGKAPVSEKVNLGVAYDEAFHFYYWDNVELFKEWGVKLQFFSPLEDKKIPANIDGLLIGGGFPEVFADKLEKNKTMREDIYISLNNGLPYYAECGGLMYLMESFIDEEGRTYEMVGWFKGQAKMTKKLQRFGYANLILDENCLFGKKGSSVRVHEFHYSDIENTQDSKVFSLVKEKRDWKCGLQKGDGLAGYPHLHFYSNLQFAFNLVENIAKKSRTRYE